MSVSMSTKLLVIVAAIAIAGSGVYMGLGANLNAAPKKTNDPSKQGSNANHTSCTSCTGDPITTDGGNKMTLTIPVVGVVVAEVDVKDHFEMPSNIGRVVVNISWDRTGWDLNVAIGTGDCPDNGQTMTDKKNVRTGPVTLEYPDTCSGTIANGQWFVHAHSNDATAHRGESVTFTYTVTVFFK